MKKILSLLLAVLMALSFCACGASSDFKAESAADYSYAERSEAPRAPEQQHQHRKHRRRDLHKRVGLHRADLRRQTCVHHTLNAHGCTREDAKEKAAHTKVVPPITTNGLHNRR